MERSAHLILLILAATTLAVASIGGDPLREIGPAIVVMELPDDRDAMRRPAVEFDHGRHTTALEREGCEACHSIDDGVLIPWLAATVDATDRDAAIDAFHGACMSCHEERAAVSKPGGPVTCGECHLRRPPGLSARIPMAYDYSLHARHAQAYPDTCDPCHHIYDEGLQKLRYEKGAEEACTSCHGAEDVEKTPSLANASHGDCISCHLERARSQLEGGPVLCVGCHEVESRQAIEQLEELPRLLRGQPDITWIRAADAGSKIVAFDHLAHEPLTSSCSTCHHQTLKACGECHTLGGAEEGDGVTMVQAFHHASSEHSCVGCHSMVAARNDCSGCHSSLSHPPGERACSVCHSGPRSTPESTEIPPPVPSKVELALLPVPSDDFPETVTIDGLVDRYEASRLPHAKIVSKLDSAIRTSSLAGRFHDTTDTLCAGCHHNSPVGTRPPPCRACHSDTAAATADKPGLKVAYHRQCLGCHIEMGIEQQSCTNCHAAKEVQQ